MCRMCCAALDCILFHSEEEGDELGEGIAVIKQSLVEEMDFSGNVMLMGT